MEVVEAERKVGCDGLEALPATVLENHRYRCGGHVGGATAAKRMAGQTIPRDLSAASEITEAVGVHGRGHRATEQGESFP